MNQSLRTLVQVAAIVMVVCGLQPALNAQGQPSFVYTNDNIPGGANTVTAFSVGSTGALTLIGTYPTGGTGTGGGLYASNRVKIGAVGSFLYVTDDGSNDVAGFLINPTNGTLGTVPGSPFATNGTGGPPPTGGISLAATPDGRFLIAGSAMSANLSVFSIAANGSLTLVSGSPFAAGGSPDGTRVTPDGAFLIAGFAGPVGVYGIAPSGVPTAVNGSPFTGSGFDSGVDVSCAGNRLFAGNYGNTTLVDVFNIAVNGALSPIPGSPFSGPGFNSNDVLLSPNNQFLFVSNQGSRNGDDTVTVFSVASNGSLTQVQGSPFHVNSGGAPSLMATDRAGAFLFTANYPQGESGASIGAFTVASNGALTAVAGSPFSVSASDLESIAVFPSATCGNPVPLINQPLVPDATAAGGSDFNLTVNGTGFVSSSVVDWNATALPTTFVNRNQLTATVPASDIATARTASVTVNNPTPGGGPSNAVPFTVTSPTTSLTFAGSTISVGLNPGNVVVADFNNDGKPDLAVVNQNQPNSGCYSHGGVGTISILLGNGDGTFSTSSTLCFPDLLGVRGQPQLVAGDFNGDGKIDLFTSFQDSEFGAVFLFQTFLGNGDGTFTTSSNLTTVSSFATVWTVITGDFNGDGKLDLAFPGFPDLGPVPVIQVFLGNGDGTFVTGPEFGQVPEGILDVALAAGDFNNDGILDLAAVGTGGGGFGPVTILLGNGDGSFTAAATQPSVVVTTPQSVAAGDFNGDGILDLAIADAGSGNLVVLQGVGDGTFNQVQGEPVSPQDSYYVTAADFNGDGKLDLAFANSCGTGCTARTITLFLGNGDGTFPAGLGQTVGNGPVEVGFGDYNADGRLDVAVSNSVDNTVSVLLQSPVASLTPPALAFGNQPLNSTSNPQIATLTNTGSATLNITSISIIGANSGDFAQNNNCSNVLAPGANCIIDVTFTPLATGSRSAALAVSDNASGSPQTVSLTGTGVLDLSITTTSLPGGTVGTAYNQTLQATGGIPPYTWSITAGTLPAGLTLTASSGVISGTPTTPGTSNFTVQVTDAKSNTGSKPLSIQIVPPQLMITTTSLPGGTVGTAYNQTLQAAGGIPPYAWSITVGTLPAGLNLNASSGVISGTPTTPETSNFTVQVTDANSNSATQPLSIQVFAPPPPAITTQPGSQQVNYGESAMLSVVAMGAPPLSYQWYVGQSGDTSQPATGETSNRYSILSVSQQTSYWVKVTNLGGSVNSSTATISVNPQSPSCGNLTIQASQATTSSQGISLSGSCADPQNSSLTGTIDWGDGTTPFTPFTGSTININHTYTVTGRCQVVVKVTNAAGLAGTTLTQAYIGLVSAVSTAAGGSANATLPVQAPPGLASPVQVVFKCVSVSGGGLSAPVPIANNGVGISCDPSQPATLTPNQQTNISLTVHSSGGPAASNGTPAALRAWRFATWLLMPGLVIAGSGLRTRSGGRRWARILGLGIAILLMGLWVACGGGASLPGSPPSVGTQTPVGHYQVTATSSPTSGTSPTGFQQTTVIVPFSVQ